MKTKLRHYCRLSLLGTLLTGLSALTSNSSASEFPAPGDTRLRMVVIGDSLMWGQGLQEENKSHFLLAEMLRGCRSVTAVEWRRSAHSGAIIGVSERDPTCDREGANCDGEVPRDHATILQQIDSFDEVAWNESVDLVLLSGGINDVSVKRICDPFRSAADIAVDTATFCFRDMQVMLRRAARHFPKARLVVCGYYQGVSDATDLLGLEAFLIASDVIVGGVVGGVTGGVWNGTGLGVVGAASVALMKPRLVENWRTFAERSRLHTRQAVLNINNELGAERILFVDPDFGPNEAMLAPNAMAFGVQPVNLSWPDPVLTPEDSMAAARKSSCDACVGVNCNPVDLNICYRASMGHPNERGARRYARVMFDTLMTGGRGVRWANFSAPCPIARFDDCGTGIFDDPFGHLSLAVNYVPEGGTIFIKSSAAPGRFSLSKPCVIEAWRGRVLVGQE